MFAFMPKKIIKLGVLVAALASISGCSSWFWDDFKNPEVQLTKVEMLKARALGQEFLFRYRIDNPNSTPLSVRGLVYRVTVEGIEVANGETGYSIEVPPNSSAYYEIPVQTNLWRHLKQVARLLKKEKPLHYELDGELKSGVVFDRRRVPIVSNGELNNPRQKQKQSITMLD